MKLSARNKKNRKPDAMEKISSTIPQKHQETTNGKYNHSIYIRCNSMLYNTMQNMLFTAHAAQDFTYVSVADLVRAALQAYSDGMPLTELAQKGEKINTTIRVDEGLKTFYQNLPDRLKSKLVERAIRTFIKSQYR
jgi:hypothetical protein